MNAENTAVFEEALKAVEGRTYIPDMNIMLIMEGTPLYDATRIMQNNPRLTLENALNLIRLKPKETK